MSPCHAQDAVIRTKKTHSTKIKASETIKQNMDFTKGSHNLLEEMTELDREIVELKEEIRGYVTERKAASSEVKRELLLETIKAARVTLNILLDKQKKAEYEGKNSNFLYSAKIIGVLFFF